MFIQAIKIDVIKKEVYGLQINGNLEGLYSAIGCDNVECIGLNRGNDLWIDGEGLLRHPQPPRLKLKGDPLALTGNGLVCGFDGEGGTIGTTLTVQAVAALVTFLGDEPDGQMAGLDLFQPLIEVLEQGRSSLPVQPDGVGAECNHLVRQGDNYGETCLVCGSVTGGYGYWGEGSSECLHQWASMGGDSIFEICLYCQRTRSKASHSPIKGDKGSG